MYVLYVLFLPGHLQYIFKEVLSNRIDNTGNIECGNSTCSRQTHTHIHIVRVHIHVPQNNEQWTPYTSHNYLYMLQHSAVRLHTVVCTCMYPQVKSHPPKYCEKSWALRVALINITFRSGLQTCIQIQYWCKQKRETVRDFSRYICTFKIYIYIKNVYLFTHKTMQDFNRYIPVHIVQ